MHLLDGRRVTIRDLLRAELLLPGEELTFTRPGLGEVHHATVTRDGELELPDGQRFRTPSRAASTAADVRALDGWHCWVVVTTKQSIDDLRQQLLDAVSTQVSDSAPAEQGQAESLRDRHAALREARQRADAGAPVTLSVRQLIDMWGAKSRGHRITREIEADLDNHGILTQPNFKKVTLDSQVTLRSITLTGDTPDTSSEDLADAGFETGITVGNIPSAMGEVTSLPPGGSINQAITLMGLNDYSQIPVVTEDGALLGAVTWESIARARHANPTASFADTIARAQDASYDRHLVDLLPLLRAHGFVVVRDDNNWPSGIVTTSDVVELYGEQSTLFLLLGELDQLLRQLISTNFSLEHVQSVCNAPLHSYDQLTFGNYQRVLADPASWEHLGWPLDRILFTERLNVLRGVRNDVMHFNPDPIPADAVNQIRAMLHLLREHG